MFCSLVYPENVTEANVRCQGRLLQLVYFKESLKLNRDFLVLNIGLLHQIVTSCYLIAQCVCTIVTQHT